MLPAYAGMIPEPTLTWSPKASAPRVCGDDPANFDRLLYYDTCSPRMRG